MLQVVNLTLYFCDNGYDMLKRWLNKDDDVSLLCRSCIVMHGYGQVVGCGGSFVAILNIGRERQISTRQV